MFKRFITWLVIKFLSNYEILKVVSDRLMTKGRDAIVMQNLYTVHDDNRKGEIDFKSFNILCLHHLMGRFGVRELQSLIYLTALKEHATYCGSKDCSDLEDLLTKIETAVSNKNHLKRVADVKAVLRDAMPLLAESEITALTHAAIQADYEPQIALSAIRAMTNKVN